MVTRGLIPQRTGPTRLPCRGAKWYSPAGHHPVSYAVRWDAAAGEYRIALKGLTPRN